MSEDIDEKFLCVSKKFPAFRENTGAFAKSPLVFLVGRKGPLRASSERRRRRKAFVHGWGEWSAVCGERVECRRRRRSASAF